MYKGLAVSQAPGHFVQQFDKLAPAPGMDWDGEPNTWFAAAFENGWVVKTAPKDAKPGALILGFDKTHSVWVGLVREATAGKIVFETLDDKGKVVQNSSDIDSIKHDFGLIGFIWPEKVAKK